MKKTLLTVPLFFLCCWFCGYGQTPDWVWARSAQSSTPGIGEGWSIATDKSNNVYVTGVYEDTLKFGSVILTTTNIQPSFLAKYDLSGNVQWAKSAVNSSTGYNFGLNVCTDVSGNAYITGFFYDTVSFGSNTFVNA